MFVSVEGVIGVGKTTATRMLAEALRGEILFEIVEENPFIKDFYQDRDAWALQLETFFLLNRVKQLEDTAKRLDRGTVVVSDYNVIKNRVFAGLTLQGSKREKYMQLFAVLTDDLPKSDLIVYLKADHSVVMERIRRRDRSFERNMDPEYIRRLAEEYEVYFAEPERYVGTTPVLTVDTTNLDLVSNSQDKQGFIERVLQALAGAPARTA